MDSVCRTCMRIIHINESAVSINDSDLREKLQACLPELILDNVVDPKMCTTCSAALSLSFRFKGMCHEAEKTINGCIQNKTNEGSVKPLNEVELLTLGRRDVDDAAIKEASNLVITGEVEVEAVSLQPLQILSDVAAQATKAAPHAHQFLTAKLIKTNLPQNWDDEIQSTRIERNPKLAKKIINNHIQRSIEDVIARVCSRTANKKKAAKSSNKGITPKKVILTPRTTRQSVTKIEKVNIDEVSREKPKASKKGDPKVNKKEKSSPKKSTTLEVKSEPETSPKSKTSKLLSANTYLASPDASKKLSLDKKQVKDTQNRKIPSDDKKINRLLKKEDSNPLVGSATPVKTEAPHSNEKKKTPRQIKTDDFESETVNTPKNVTKLSSEIVIPLENEIEPVPVKNVTLKNNNRRNKRRIIPKYKKTNVTKSGRDQLLVKTMFNNKQKKINNNTKRATKKTTITTPTASQTPTEITNDVANAIGQLLQTPEYKKLLRLQTKADESPLKLNVTQQLQRLETFFKDYEHNKDPPPPTKRKTIEPQHKTTTTSVSQKRRRIKPRSPRTTRALEEINLDLAEISEGVQKQALTATVTITTPNKELIPDDTPLATKTISTPIKHEIKLEKPEAEIQIENVYSLRQPQQRNTVLFKKVDGRSNKRKQPPQSCEQCGKVFKYISHLNVHRRAHLVVKSHKCELCGKCFTLERYLSLHRMMHFTAGDHQCRICQKYFSSWHVLKKHEMTHTGEKPFVCEVCNKSFTQTTNLRIHKLVHIGKRNFVCYTCNSAFSQKVHLEAHCRTHTGEKPYACDLCPKAYAKSNVLRDHKALHAFKPFMCKDCNHLYRDEEALNRHVTKYKKFTGHTSMKCGKVHNCGICSRSFTSRYSRNRHMKVHVKDLIEATTTKF